MQLLVVKHADTKLLSAVFHILFLSVLPPGIKIRMY